MRILTLSICFAASLYAAGPASREMSRAELRDRIEGAWAGQMIGVSYGAPTEFKAQGRILEGDLPKWTPGRVSNSLGQDDLYVDMTFAKVLDDKGLGATSDDFGAMFRDSKYALWHANMEGRRALKRGVPGHLSGNPKYNAHADDIDFQIEADFIGVMAPGLYRSSNDIALRAGRVMNYGDGVYGGMFVSCMYSAAFFESDPRRVVEAGLTCIPAKSPYARLISDVLAWHKQNPSDWKKTWQLLHDKWDRDDACPVGALTDYNIDAKLNGGFIALGLLYGERDFFKTLDISTRAGQDSDCNPASAGGILGVMLGYKAIPEEWKGGIPAIADQKFRFTDFSFRTIVESTEKRALALIQKTGGRVEGDRVTVKLETVRPPKLELWNPGRPAERIGTGDARWTWKGAWKEAEGKRRDGSPRGVKTAAEKGAEAALAFDGAGIMISGSYLPAGGTADVYLDGKLDRRIDVYSDGDGARGGNAIWHAWGLKNGNHTVRLVVRGEPFRESKGSEISIDDAIVFRR
ncbi:MAG: ADP-ribosylglycohydrolase family protein [Acidobacteria bacterium]|nr:ADP-ribosylglycohydrolase family protein [Acidobacteriota bacterium]